MSAAGCIAADFGSFSRIRQVAPVCPDGISIGSAVLQGSWSRHFYNSPHLAAVLAMRAKIKADDCNLYHAREP